MATFLFEPTPNKDAVDFIKSKPAVTRSVFNKLLPELKPRAFTITGIQVADVLQRSRDLVAKLPAGGNWDDIKKDLVTEISPYFVDKTLPADEQASQQRAAERRAELLIRTHGQQAYAAAQYGMLNEQRDLFPMWQYMSLGDDHVRPTHKALDGIVLPADHEFWQTHFPPWEWGCRCQCIPLTRSDTVKMQQADKDKPADAQRVLGDYAQAELTTSRRLVRNGVTYNLTAAREENKPGAYAFHPADLRIDAATLKDRYDADIFAKFSEWAKKQDLGPAHGTVWDWMNRHTPEVAEPVDALADADALHLALKPHIDQYLAHAAAIDAEAAQLAAERAALNGTAADYWVRWDSINRRVREFVDRRKAILEPIIAAGRDIVALPAHARGSLPVLGAIPPAVHAIADEGRRIVESYVHREILPQTSFARLRSGARAFHQGQTAHLSPTSGASTAAHEIVHGIEKQHPHVLDKARAFLAQRAAGRKPVKLGKIYPGHGYKAIEVTLEDEWIARGGHAYTGKLYSALNQPESSRATELLTMGIERLHANPVLFAHSDPEYFAFVVNTLRNL